MLETLFFTPLLTSLITFFLPEMKFRKGIVIVFSLIPLAFLLSHSPWIGADISHMWISSLSISFHLAVDRLSLIFIYLTATIIPIAIYTAEEEQLYSANFFYGMVLILQGLLIGFFTSRDLALFVIFWEAMLLPLYFLIASYGKEGKKEAALKFLIYMIAGSAFLIAAVLSLFLSSGGKSFVFQDLAPNAENVPGAFWIAAAFILAFAVKTPLFPFHGWLREVYCQASTAGTILLSALLSKAGIYGFYRIGGEFFPGAMQVANPVLLIFAIIGVFWSGLAAWRQGDYKAVLAYSSLSHVNFILAGFFVWNRMAGSGALLQAFNHGITITALFLAAGWLEKRLGTTGIYDASGLTKYLPKLAWLTLFFVLSSVALPGTNNFIGELMIFLGLFMKSPSQAAILMLSVILSVMYMLRWMQKMYFGPPSESEKTQLDIGIKEIAMALPLVFLILWIGIYPAPFLDLVKWSPIK